MDKNKLFYVCELLSEDQLQAQIWQKAWNEYPEARRCMWAVPNSAIGKIMTFKDQMQANKLKATGLLDGVWDLHLFWKSHLYLFELKVGNNHLTYDHIDNKNKIHHGQKQWGEIMRSQGAITHVVWSVEEFFTIYHPIIRP